MKPIDLHSALDVAVDATKRAGDVLSKYQQTLRKEGYEGIGVSSKGRVNDYVSKADVDAQRVIVERIQKDFPDHRFLGEEGGTDELGDPASPYLWIIDPLDGTTNFIHGKPNYGTIIALQKNDKTILGVLYRPLFKEIFTGIRGEGAFFNGKPITLRKTAGISDAVLCCNIVHRAQKDEQGILWVPVPFCASIENYGNAVEEFAVVLKGWNDGVFFSGPRLWDVAAGCLLIEEAGGQSRTELKEPGNLRSGTLCVATTKKIFKDIEHFVFSELNSAAE